MKIVLAFVGPLNSFILNEAECEGLPEGCQVSVKTRCQGAGIAPTGVIINIPGRGDLDAMAALLDEANLKIEACEKQIKNMDASVVELLEELGRGDLSADSNVTPAPTKKAGKK